MDDPVMGGESHGSFQVSAGVGVFAGEVVDVPSLKAPGFLKASTASPSPRAGWRGRREVPCSRPLGRPGRVH